VPLPVDTIDGPGRYFLQFVNPDPKQAATRLHPDWESQVADAIAAQSGLNVANVISGSYTYTATDGSQQPRWGVLLELQDPGASTAYYTGGQVTVQPAQLFIPVAIAVLAVVAIIGTDLALSHIADDFLSAVKITTADKNGPWTKLASAAQTGAWAAVLFAAAVLVLAVIGRRRWQAA